MTPGTVYPGASSLPPTQARLNKLATKCLLTGVCYQFFQKKKNSWIQAYFYNPDCSASTPMGDSRRHALRHNIVVTKPPQGHPASCPTPPPRNSTLISKAGTLLLLSLQGLLGTVTALVTLDKSQTFLLHLPRVEKPSWVQVSPKEKESLCLPSTA